MMTTGTTPLTPGQRFAREYGAKAVEDMLSAIAWAKRIALAITVAAMAVSYQHQREHLTHKGMDQFGATVVPLMIDAVTLLCVKIISTTGMARVAKTVALCFQTFPVGASAVINFNASPNAYVGWVYVVAVLFIALVETLKALIRPDFVAILAEEDRVTVPATQIGRKPGKRCESGCTCGKHTRQPRRRRRATTRKPLAASPVSGAPLPLDELNVDMVTEA
jgi:hypothetical protein